jgi:subtilisin family serine protease
MKTNSFIAKISNLLLSLTVLLSACSKQENPANNAEQADNQVIARTATSSQNYIKDAYIVVLRDEIQDVDAEVEQIIKGLGGAKPDHKYTHTIKGFSIKAAAAAIQGLSRNPKIKYIEQDQVATKGTTQSSATWGLDRVDQRNLPLSGTYTYNTNGSTVDAYIFDTGIRTDHVEFNGRRVFGYDAFGGVGNDIDGHGSHVAGTVGGTTFGIAKAIRLIAVKVLGDDGSGTLSGVIAGIDWAAGHHVAGKPAVGNMSLGSSYSQSVNDAVVRAINDGIVMCVAAGNSNANASNYSPASTVEAITVGATTSSDSRASYSNFGSVLDIFAPGSSITSAGVSSNTATAVLSGTSMACPHVAGVAALYLEANPGATPAQVQQGLKSSATPNVVLSAGTGSPNLLLFSGSFTPPSPTPPPAPTLLSPSNGATGRPINNSAVSWSASTGATSYTLQLSTSTDFTTPVLSQAGLTTTSASISGLSFFTTYYWRVGATNSVGTSWSAVWSFTTLIEVPSLLSPSNAATGVVLTPTLSWSNTGATSYDVQVSNKSNFSSLLVSNTRTTTSISLSGLRNLTTYYWRVRARTSNGSVSAWSASRRFTTQ